MMLNLNICCKEFETFFGFNIILVLILFKYNLIQISGRMAELVDAHDSKSCFARSESSILLRPPKDMEINKQNNL